MLLKHTPTGCPAKVFLSIRGIPLGPSTHRGFPVICYIIKTRAALAHFASAYFVHYPASIPNPSNKLNDYVILLSRYPSVLTSCVAALTHPFTHAKPYISSFCPSVLYLTNLTAVKYSMSGLGLLANRKSHYPFE